MPRGDGKKYGEPRTYRKVLSIKQYVPQKLNDRIFDYEKGHLEKGGKDMTQQREFKKPGSQK